MIAPRITDYKRVGSKETIDVSWRGYIFNGVEIKCPQKCKNCYSQRGKNNSCYTYKDGVCWKSEKKRIVVYNIITTIVISGVSFSIFFFLDLNIILKLLLVAITFIYLDIVCNLFEKNISQIRKKMFEKNVVRIIKKEKKKWEKGKNVKVEEILDEEKAKVLRDLEERVENANKDIERFVSIGAPKYLSDTAYYDCNEKLLKMKKIINNDHSRYYEVETIFEDYIPRVYNVITYVIDYMSKKDVENNKDVIDTMNKALNSFLKALNDPKINPIISDERGKKRIGEIADEIEKLLEKSNDSNIDNGKEDTYE